MSSELPSASGRSVFSVFGFGSSHYSQDEDFSSPLETAPESFDASYSLTAVTKRAKKVAANEEAMTSLSSETEHKLRLNPPDQSDLAVQSFCQSNKTSSSTHHPQGSHSLARRYSTAQEETGDTLSSSSEVLTKFNNTLTQTTYMLTKAGGTNPNIYYNSARDASAVSHISTTSIPSLTRVQSSPHLSVVPMGSPHKESLLGSDMILQYMRRHQSQNDLLEVAEYKTSDDALSNASFVGSSVDVSSTVTIDPPKFKEDLTDTHNSGFSILSRTRQFGTWLTKATDGEKVDISKKDLNVLAPNSF